MDEFYAIATDLTAWEQSSPPYSARNFRPAAKVSASPAVSRSHSELRHLAVLVCVMASAANALKYGSDNTELASLMIDFCPTQLFDGRTAAELIEDHETGDQITEYLQELQTRLSFSQTLTKHLDGKFRRSAKVNSGDIEILADAWRRTSASILAVLRNLKVSHLSPDEAENVTLVVGFLKNCIAGGSPCLSEDGQLEIPGWAERRSAERIAVEHTAQASTGGDYFEVAVLNASTIGLGLAGDAKSGDHTTIVFADGRKVSGTVKWSEDGRFGLQLDQPIGKSDRLLASDDIAH